MSMLPRFQLFEIHDVEWVPDALRDSIVESLSRSLRWGGILRGLVGPLSSFLEAAGTREVLDLCSGAGGPAQVVVDELRRGGVAPPRFVMTDLRTHLESWRALKAREPDALDFHPEPVDATRIPVELSQGRARVLMNAFHHFPPPLARSILADAVQARAPFFLSEAFERNPLRFLNFTHSGLLAALANPVLAPRHRLAKALITWLVPIVFPVAIWDGFVSTLRVYTEAELREMVAPFGADYRWIYGTYRYPPFGKGYYFHGIPAARRDHS